MVGGPVGHHGEDQGRARGEMGESALVSPGQLVEPPLLLRLFQIWEIYEEWPVDGDPQEITLSSGATRKSWPLTWDGVAAALEKASDAIKRLRRLLINRARRPALKPSSSAKSTTRPCRTSSCPTSLKSAFPSSLL